MSGEGCMAKIAGGRIKIDKFEDKLWIVAKKESEMSERMASAALRRSSIIAGACSLVGSGE
jgi:hypothetical protein